MRTAPPSRVPLPVHQDRLSQMLKLAMMGGTKHEQIGIVVCAAFCYGNDVVHMEDGGAAPAQEAAVATALITREDALSCLRRQCHDNSRKKDVANAVGWQTRTKFSSLNKRPRVGLPHGARSSPGNGGELDRCFRS